MRKKMFGICCIFCSMIWGELSFAAFASPEEYLLTIPAEVPGGIEVELEEGHWRAEVAGGAVTLWYPFHPQYQWVWGLSVARHARGGSDIPDLGTLFVDQVEHLTSQAATEQVAMEALQAGVDGTVLIFELEKKCKVRFWVGDFDYSDNSGFLRVKVYKNE